MRKQINDKLKSLTALAALVGTRIYRGSAPTNEPKPYVTWRVLDDDNGTHPINGPRTHDRSTISIEIWSDSGPMAQTVADSISKDTSAAAPGLDHDISTLDGKQFTFLCDDAGGDGDELSVPGSEQALFNITQTWTVWHDPA